MAEKMKKIIIGITGASGAVLGIRALQVLREVKDVETHLIISKAAQITIAHETDYTPAQVQKLADVNHKFEDISAACASGSFRADGMIIAPCSIRTMSEIASGVTSSLMSRAADVMLKERKKLVLMVRETPLHQLHLENMARLASAGAFIMPPVITLYNKPETIDDMVNHLVGRALDIFDIDAGIVKRWEGLK
jgi:4-hydroxy-3-polyprenylbenzoate decarboxylase